MGIPDPIFKLANVVHGRLYDLSGGRLGRSVGSMPVLKLTTTGRRSGQQRTVMLTAPIRRDDEIVLVASKGGNDEHPAWYLNLVADPAVILEIDGQRRNANARTATDEEKAELWPQITAAYKGYAGYQRRTDRDIPVVICTLDR
jgi:deazaflavin-dependent oxidoreductase (nitroreductase family)